MNAPRMLIATLLIGLLAAVAAAEEGRWAEAEGHHFFYWAERVRNGTREERDRALRVIRKAGPVAKSAVPGLIDDLVRPDDYRRDQILKALVAIGKPAVWHLAPALSDSSAYVRIWCARALGEIGPDASKAVDALAATMTPDAHVFERREAAIALGRIGAASARAIPALEDAVSLGDPELSLAAITSLGQIGEPSREALGRLTTHEDESVARAAAAEIQRLTTEPPPDLSALVAALREGTDEDRERAAHALGALGAAAAAAVPDLVRVIEDDSLDVSRAAINALGRLGSPTADAALPPLAARLADPRRGLHAATAVARFGTAGLTHLCDALGHDSWRVRERAARFMGEVDAPAAALLPPLLRALGDKSSAVRWHGAQGLAGLGEAGAVAVPQLLDALEDSREDIRVAAARALFSIGHRESVIAPALIDGLTSRTWMLSDGTAEALIAMGKRVVHPLCEALLRSRRSLATDIAAVLHEIGEPAVPALLAGLCADDPGVRLASIEALRFLGDDEKVVPVLRTLLEDEDERVRDAAAKAVKER